jgi:hypothetical protein
MALEKDSMSSTPPTSHNEVLPHHHDHQPHEYRHTTVDGQPAYAERKSASSTLSETASNCIYRSRKTD